MVDPVLNVTQSTILMKEFSKGYKVTAAFLIYGLHSGQLSTN